MDGIHDHHRGLQFVDGGQHFFELRFCQHLHLRFVESQPARAQGHLRARFFAGHIQGVPAAALQTVHRLQQQGRFTNARVATDQHHATLDHPATQNAVEFFLAGGCARYFRRFNIRQGRNFCRRHQRRHSGVAVFDGPAGFDRAFDEGVPGIATWALAQPFGTGAAAFGAGVLGFVFGHVANDTG